jgi:hypothetical protein
MLHLSLGGRIADDHETKTAAREFITKTIAVLIGSESVRMIPEPNSQQLRGDVFTACICFGHSNKTPSEKLVSVKLPHPLFFT